ncbi:hypothetical protein GCM10012275_45720 [Longimycelium tulufanense]|uniref:Ig-like domain-containing protein n=1 Tax=Longimycelium tulufanense TaxID=907463 RepID=A0A8J3FW97_9PSEU|nr:hypothetical protein [Longimycelium tulufanense]GGM70153.1 hypothetical protein GCM10012275_45720 [Longimycelium tulufanense]
MGTSAAPRRGLALPTVIAGLLCLPATPAATAPADSLSWVADITVVDSDDSNVTVRDGVLRLAETEARALGARRGGRAGFLVLPPYGLSREANRVAARVTSSVPPSAELAVDVRGKRSGGGWTEWVEARPEAPAVLPEPTTTVQVRVLLGAESDAAGPELRRLELTADSVPASRSKPPAELPERGYTFRVHATREGLVGGTTANGHVIQPRDHFAALPSRRGLSPRGHGDYSVQVCADNGRCEWAPVWDVGPWNTRDDYWNTPDIREMWRDLPHGKPQAQAAHMEGYHGGLDQFGRVVTNPSGIDLADGTYWDGLKLDENAWVDVTYLWTGYGVFGTVRTFDEPLSTHREPSLVEETENGMAARAARVPVECETVGPWVHEGSPTPSNRWLRIGPEHFVAKAWVTVDGPVVPC